LRKSEVRSREKTQSKEIFPSKSYVNGGIVRVIMYLEIGATKRECTSVVYNTLGR
jgi:hypothetical protein